MIYNLSEAGNLRGYAFEYIAKVILRRERNNNFIFQTSQFDSIDEILTKYRLKIGNHSQLIELLRKRLRACDLIEFILKNTDDRDIIDIELYDIKTKFKSNIHVVDRCLSGELFVQQLKAISKKLNIIVINLLEEWKFELTCVDNVRINVYTRHKA